MIANTVKEKHSSLQGLDPPPATSSVTSAALLLQLSGDHRGVRLRSPCDGQVATSADEAG